MTVRRLVAIAFILIGTSLAWTVLGSSLLARTGQFDGRLEPEVQLVWGGPHRTAASYAARSPSRFCIGSRSRSSRHGPR